MWRYIATWTQFSTLTRSIVRPPVVDTCIFLSQKDQRNSLYLRFIDKVVYRATIWQDSRMEEVDIHVYWDRCIFAYYLQFLFPKPNPAICITLICHINAPPIKLSAVFPPKSTQLSKNIKGVSKKSKVLKFSDQLIKAKTSKFTVIKCHFNQVE